MDNLKNNDIIIYKDTYQNCYRRFRFIKYSFEGKKCQFQCLQYGKMYHDYSVSHFDDATLWRKATDWEKVLYG